MENCFELVPLAVNSPVRASIFAINGISMPFFHQITYRKQLPEALGYDTSR